MFRFHFFLLMCFTAPLAYSQVEVKLVSQNDLKIGADSCYSRAFGFSNDHIWMAASNGSVYCFDMKKQQNMFHTGSFQLQELRDVHINESKILAMMSGSKGRLLEIDDLGARAIDTSIFDNVFLDAFDINTNGFGVMIGDPIDDYFNLFLTRDYGKSWSKVNKSIKAGEKEYAYAASGSIIRVTSDSSFVFVTGGKESSFYKVHIDKENQLAYRKSKLEFKSKEGSGAFSMSLIKDSIIIVVGGCYLESTNRDKTCFVSLDFGTTWKPSIVMPNGYRSSVIYDSKHEVLYSSGRNGIDYSLDDGMSWYKLTDSPAFSLHLFEDRLYGSSSKGVIKVFELKVL